MPSSAVAATDELAVDVDVLLVPRAGRPRRLIVGPLDADVFAVAAAVAAAAAAEAVDDVTVEAVERTEEAIDVVEITLDAVGLGDRAFDRVTRVDLLKF